MSIADYIRILYAALPVLATPRSIERAPPIAGDRVARLKAAVSLAGVTVGELRKTLSALQLVPGIRELATELLSRDLIASAADAAEPTATIASDSVARLDAALRHLGGQAALLLRAFHELAQDEPAFVRVPARGSDSDLACTMITSSQGLDEMLAWLKKVRRGQPDTSAQLAEQDTVEGWKIFASTSPGGVKTHFVAANVEGLPLIAPWVVQAIRLREAPSWSRGYVIYGIDGLDPDIHFFSLAEAVEAVRSWKGWPEIHLSDETLQTEASISTWTAYPTANDRDAASDRETAPEIWEM